MCEQGPNDLIASKIASLGVAKLIGDHTCLSISMSEHHITRMNDPKDTLLNSALPKMQLLRGDCIGIWGNVCRPVVQV